MARHLAEKGQEVSVYDVRPEAVEALSALPNVHAATSVATAAREADVVFTSLPGPPEVESVVLGEGGLGESMAAGTVYVDLSTNAPSMVRTLGPILKEKGVDMLDAPVSGGVEGAAAATLSIMVGGSLEVFERVRPQLECIGTKLFYCGDLGAGSVVKLCNNICSASFGLVLSEALTVGVKAGVDLATLAEVIGASTGSALRLTNKMPRYLFKRNFEPGFAAALSQKDTRLMLELADEVNVPMAVGTLTKAALDEILARGLGDRDSDITSTLQEERAGVTLQLP
jgi:3-hydroxyisobutyrate dehydrogenase-like beta-hydroxyacid dehydrogenase